jgi:hypothetical protein
MNEIAEGRVRYPDFVTTLDAKTIVSIGEKYLTGIADLMSLSRPYATDKLLANFLNIGLMHLALPNATILHTERNALDTCISCFSKRFTHGHEYVYDLAELGRYYKRYQRLMQHWYSVLPPGRVLDIRYEEVVADLEGQAG